MPVIVNAPPTVSLTAPTNNTVLFAPTDVAITAQASDADGTVAKVEFFQGQTLLGTVTQAPYAFTWLSAPPGTYSLTAKATDNRGASTVSAPAALTVDIPPSVSLTATAPGDLVAPTALALTAQASDPDGSVAKVEFHQGNTLLGTVSQVPYAFTWNNVPAGNYSFTAKATDNLGGTTISAPVLLTVAPNQPPSVTLTAPQQNQTFAAPATVALAASASDADGQVAKVAFYQGQTLLGTATQAPYAYTWSNVAAGSYTLTAQATDNKGATTVSSPLTLTVIPAQVKGVFYIYPDHLGTPRVVTDVANKVVWRNDPLGDPFGADTPNEDPDGDGARFTLNLRFPGQYFDAETGLSYNYFRDYDPSIGRYVQSDPIGLDGGINTYTYVNGNPIGYIDPEGLFRYSPTAGGPVNAPTAAGLTCFEQCIGGREITVTAGREGGHSPGSAHETGQACDVGKNSNPGVNRQDAQRCFQQCFDQSHSYGQEERNHYHFQTRPGAGGATGFAPGVH